LSSSDSEIEGIFSGLFHTCAIQDGSGYCWGRGTDGQLANGHFRNQRLPKRIAIESRITSAAGGIDHGCFTTENNVYCSGRNDHGQLGSGSLIGPVHAPVPNIQLPNGRKSVAAGFKSTCMLVSGRGNGSLWCYGLNNYGQLGLPALGDESDLDSSGSENTRSSANDEASRSVLTSSSDSIGVDDDEGELELDEDELDGDKSASHSDQSVPPPEPKKVGFFKGLKKRFLGAVAATGQD